MSDLEAGKLTTRPPHLLTVKNLTCGVRGVERRIARVIVTTKCSAIQRVYPI